MILQSQHVPVGLEPDPTALQLGTTTGAYSFGEYRLQR